MSSRERILARIRAARVDVRGPESTGPEPSGSEPSGPEPSGPEPTGHIRIPRDYRAHRDIPEGLLDRFCERIVDYGGQVDRVPATRVAETVARALQALGARRVAVAEGCPLPWRPTGFVLVPDPADAPLGVEQLQALDAVVTGAAVAIAETGTIVLDGTPLCGRRALTLVPDAHVCVVDAADVVDGVPAALARLDPRQPLTWVSGPSATSDIELSRVEGVHGPRQLHLVLIEAELPEPPVDG